MNDPATSEFDDGFERRLEAFMGGDAPVENEDLQAAAAMQQRIDDSLRRSFPPGEAPAKLLAQLRASESSATPRAADAPSRRLTPAVDRRMFVAVAAAVVVAATASLWLRDRKSLEPYFETTPLTALYQRAVDAGFEPYYECDDPARFAAVFRNQLGVPLQLAAMPAGTRMLGLSYPGGLSRETTAMLCHVDGKRVMVFVDRADRDEPKLAAEPNDRSLRIFRTQRDGLVFYEATPYDSPRVTKYLQPAPAS